MQLKSIITLASKPVELMFRAMERSLRATGCQLPLKVIPYNEDRFELPENADWWEEPEFIKWIDAAGRRPVMRKYQALLAADYQFVDTDVVFLRNPEEVLAKHEGFVTSCGHWHNPGETLTDQALKIYQKSSTIWQSKVFNTGQFACDRALYDLNSLKRTAEDSRYRATVLENRFHEQPGIVLLTHLSGVPITNLTLPPHEMESTWAGDYPGEFDSYWKDSSRKPYLIHWAGAKMAFDQPLTNLFLPYLTEQERQNFLDQKRRETSAKRSAGQSFLMRIKRSARAALTAWKAKGGT